MSLQTSGINPNDYITIPDRYKRKYKSTTYGLNMTDPAPQKPESVITVIHSDNNDAGIIDADYKPVQLESINKTMVDSVEINE